jgi:hypothetical protein
MGWIWTVVLNSGLGLAAYGVSRFGLRQPAGLVRTLAAAVLAWGWLTIGVEALGAIGWLDRGPLLGWVSAGLVVALGCWGFGRNEPAPVSAGEPAEPWTWEEFVSLGLILWAAATLWGPAVLWPVKVVSDGPIYHLYFAARWWKAHRLDLIAAPFGETAATYFPAIGDLWFTWLIVGFGGERLAKTGQVPFLALAAVAAIALARRLGAGRPASVLAATWFIASTPLFLFSFEPNVDTIFVAGYVLSAYFFARYVLADDGYPSLALAALAGGLALGTKAPAIVFVPPLLTLGAASAIARGKGFRGKLAGVIVVVALPLTVSGFFYVRNALNTGNPLYPLHLAAFGRVWLRGWYGPDVMRLSRYYVPVTDWRALIDTLLAVVDPRLAPVWLAALAGAWAVGRERANSPACDRLVWGASALAVVNVGLYWVAIPYRTQQRFMYHAISLAAVPLARTFDRHRALRVVGVGLLAVHLLTPQTWPFAIGEPPWDLTSKIPNGILAPIRLWDRPGIFVVETLIEGLIAFVTSWTWLRAVSARTAARRAWALATTSAYVASTLVMSYPWGLDERRLFYPSFREYYHGWLAFDTRSGPAGARVAYAGTDLPFYLMGEGLRNDVRYVNIDAHPGWLMHDYHLAALRAGSGPATWPFPRPGWDRVHPDYDAWLANLRAEGIQLLVVTLANPDEGPHNIVDASNFPIERQWAEDHRESFEPLYGEDEDDPQFRLYRVKPRPRETTIPASDLTPLSTGSGRNLKNNPESRTDRGAGPH